MRIRSPLLHPALKLALVLAVAFVAIGRPLAAGQGDARERTLFVSAVDNKGEPVEGLGPDAFVVTEDGRRREVLRVSKATEPMDIALLIDNSQASQSVNSHMRAALSSFVASLAPANQIAVITLADRPTIVTDYTNDVKKLSDAVKIFAMPASGMTLLDAVVETAKGISKREPVRPVMVGVITDGTEFTNRYSRDAAKALADAGAQLHLIGIGRFEHSEEQQLRERSFFLDEGPRTSGGQFVMILSPNALEQTMDRLARELKAQYKVVYSRPESLVPPEKTEITSAKPDITMRGSLSRESKDRR